MRVRPRLPVSARSDPLGQHTAPILCYVTDRRSLPLEGAENARVALARKMETLLRAGIDWVQIREKDLAARELSTLTRESMVFAAAGREAHTAARILVNDRLDVALADQAGGVHLGENGLPLRHAKRLVEARGSGGGFLVGVSCHSLDAAKSAGREGADYVFFGPVFATPSKARFGVPQGIERLASVCRAVEIPVLAIGGVTLENAGRCLAAGAAGIAAIRLFQDAAEPARIIQSLRNFLP
jgi:thiamine-phosphate pyrophosphorylase